MVKERCGYTRHGLTFTQMPNILTNYIVLNTVKMLNLFLTKGGISDSLIPKTSIPSKTLDFKNHPPLQLGRYYQVHEEESPCNSHTLRTKGEIFVSPSVNLQGRYKSMALSSGKKIFRRNWELIPMSDMVVSRVKTLCLYQPTLIIFIDRRGRLIGDVETPVGGAN